MAQTRPLRWFTIPVRAVLVTFVCTLIAFAVGLLFGIIGTLVSAKLRHVHPDMTVAYRLVALPIAIVAGSVVFVLSLAIEIRHYRQSKTLAGIERIS
jgi:ABC-type antimicrobial peptide transport system permease subunit